MSIYNYVVVHTTTLEEWNCVLKHYGYDWNNKTFEIGQNCVNMNDRAYCSLEYYSKEGAKIHTFKEWMEIVGMKEKEVEYEIY